MQDIDRKADTELSGKELPCSWRECLSNTSKTVSLLDVFSQGSARDWGRSRREHTIGLAGVLLWYVGEIRINAGAPVSPEYASAGGLLLAHTGPGGGNKPSGILSG